MPNKFSIGDKVTIIRGDVRTPRYLSQTIRLDHPRTIVATFYDDKTQHTRYYLGTNKRGNPNLPFAHFRASQLRLWVKGNIGRPKAPRGYSNYYRRSLGVLSLIPQKEGALCP